MAAMKHAAPPGPCDTDQPASVLAGWPAAASAMAGAEQSVADLGAILQLARAMAEAGRRVDLGGLQALMGRLCARSLDLMPEEGRRIAPHLAGVLAEIDALHGVLLRQEAAGAPS